jgi:uncharacterized spore protein YtfJ
MTESSIQTSSAERLAAEAEALQVIQDIAVKYLASASVEAVYGKPQKVGDTLIIPTAEVVNGLGFGLGSGSGSGGPGGPEGASGSGSGAGGGAGGGLHTRPVAIIIASPEGVRVEPVVDATKIALALFTTLGFMFGMLFRMLQPRR